MKEEEGYRVGRAASCRTRGWYEMVVDERKVK